MKREITTMQKAELDRAFTLDGGTPEPAAVAPAAASAADDPDGFDWRSSG